MKSMKVQVIVLMIVVAATRLLHGQAREIVVYGQNSPEWNEKLGVTATRGSCNLSPDSCIEAIDSLLKAQHTNRLYQNLVEDPAAVVAYASRYSRASLKEPRLYELDLDDFPDHFNIWCRMPKSQCDVLLFKVIQAAKSENPALRFGVTIYEDQIGNLLENPKLTPELRRRIDSIHLYLHYSADGPEFQRYVGDLKKAFPNAGVIAGIYAYDRSDYIDCAPSKPGRCTLQQASNLYKETLSTQVRLLRQGILAGLEFYPGYFGLEDRWRSWDDPKVCKPTRKLDCIANTRMMRDEAFKILRAGESR